MDRWHEEQGSALAIVMLVGTALVLLTAVVVSRSSRLVGNTESDARWDQSLNVAESCLDVGLAALGADAEWTTGETLPTGTLGSETERSWAIGAVASRSGSDATQSPEGECFAIRPVNSDALYSVGFVPSRTASERRVRVVRAMIEMVPTEAPFVAAFGFLTNDDLLLAGNSTSHGTSASIHTNATLTATGNPTLHDACLTASGGGSVSGNVNVHASCPLDPYSVEAIEVPEIVAREFWSLSEYDMCQDGVVRAGPAHPTLGGSAGSSPCTSGHEIDSDGSFRGWEFDGCCDPVEGAQWSYPGNKANDGAYFFHGATVRITGGPGSNNKPMRTLIVVEAQGVCSSQTAGDFYLSGSAVLAPYQAEPVHADNSTVVVAGRDVQWSGNGRLKIPGIIAAAEQIAVSGNPQVEGSFIGENWCDSPADNLDETSISGNPTFTFDDPLDTIWITSDGPPIPTIASWDEL